MSEPFDPYHKWLGIPATEQPPNHYRLLGLALFESDLDVIEAAADRQMAHVRTYQTGERRLHSQRMLNELAAAARCLLEAHSREAYDAAVTASLPRPASSTSPSLSGISSDPMAIESVPVRILPIGITIQRPFTTINEGIGNRAGNEDPRSRLAICSLAVSPGKLHSDLSGRRNYRTKRNPSLAFFVALGVALSISAIACLVLLSRRTPTTSPTPKTIAETASKRPEAKWEPHQQFSPTHAVSKIVVEGNASGSTVKQGSLDTEDTHDHPSTVADPQINRAIEPFSSADEQWDLLELVRTAQDGVKGKWEVIDGQLLSPSSDEARLQLPLKPSKEYILRITGQRESGSDLAIGLIIGGKHALVFIDSEIGPRVSGLHLVDGQSLGKNVTTTPANVLGDRRPYTIVCVVHSDQVSVSCNGANLFTWKGQPSRLSFDSSWAVPDSTRLFIGCHHSVHRFTSITLEPITSAHTVPLEFPLSAPSEAPNGNIGPKSTFQAARVIVDPKSPRAVARWDFTAGLKDQIGSADVSLYRGAARDEDGLRLNGAGAYAETAVLNQSLSDRTLEVELTLANTAQRGAAPMSICIGDVFDAIVFGELSPGEWIAGSDHFSRTKRLEAKKELVAGVPLHLVISYASNGTVAIYRNGLPYARPYQVAAAVRFPEQARILFGSRVLSPPVDQTLAGTIKRASLYNYAFTENDARALDRLPSTRIDQSVPNQGKVFLVDLPPEDVRVWGAGRLDDPLSFNRKPQRDSLSMHPIKSGSSHAAFRINGQYITFEGTAAITDLIVAETASPLSYRIVGDGRELWKSRPLRKAASAQKYRVNVEGVYLLELFVDCPGEDGYAHAAWIGPKLTPSTPTNKVKQQPAN